MCNKNFNDIYTKPTNSLCMQRTSLHTIKSYKILFKCNFAFSFGLWIYRRLPSVQQKTLSGRVLYHRSKLVKIYFPEKQKRPVNINHNFLFLINWNIIWIFFSLEGITNDFENLLFKYCMQTNSYNMILNLGRRLTYRSTHHSDNLVLLCLGSCTVAYPILIFKPFPYLPPPHSIAEIFWFRFLNYKDIIHLLSDFSSLIQSHSGF